MEDRARSVSEAEGLRGRLEGERAPTAEQTRDALLVERAVGGDLDAFNQLVEAYQDYLYALVVRVVGDRYAASDAVQEAFFSAYRHLGRLKGGE